MDLLNIKSAATEETMKSKKARRIHSSYASSGGGSRKVSSSARQFQHVKSLHLMIDTN
jgi:hypothetical protein